MVNIHACVFLVYIIGAIKMIQRFVLLKSNICVFCGIFFKQRTHKKLYISYTQCKVLPDKWTICMVVYITLFPNIVTKLCSLSYKSSTESDL